MANVFKGTADQIETNLNKVEEITDTTEDSKYPSVKAIRDYIASIVPTKTSQLENDGSDNSSGPFTNMGEVSDYVNDRVTQEIKSLPTGDGSGSDYATYLLPTSKAVMDYVANKVGSKIVIESAGTTINPDDYSEGTIIFTYVE